MVLNNMYKNKYNTVQSRYVLDMMFGKSSGFLLIAFITYAYAKCIIQCISISSKFVFYQPITYNLLLYVTMVWLLILIGNFEGDSIH